MKSLLGKGEIAAAVGGFHSTYMCLSLRSACDRNNFNKIRPCRDHLQGHFLFVKMSKRKRGFWLECVLIALADAFQPIFRSLHFGFLLRLILIGDKDVIFIPKGRIDGKPLVDGE